MMSGTNTSSTSADWLRRSARLGYAAIGVVYVMMAAIAARAVLGWPSGRDANPKHAMRWLELDSSFGSVALVAIAVGMLGYGVWRGLAAFTDPEREGAGPGGLLKRAGFLLSGLTHAALAVEAFHYAAGAAGAAHPSSSTRDGASGWTAAVMRVSAGRWLVCAVGIGIAAYAIYEGYRSVRWNMHATLERQRGPAAARTLLVVLGRFGMAVRAVVILVIGVLLVRAAVEFDPSQAAGLGKAIGAIGQWRFGRYAVAITAVGLASYGIYQILMAWYRRVELA